MDGVGVGVRICMSRSGARIGHADWHVSFSNLFLRVCGRYTPSHELELKRIAE